MNLKKVCRGAVLSTCARTGGAGVWVRDPVIFVKFSQKLKRWEFREPDLSKVRGPWLSWTAACVDLWSSNSQNVVVVVNVANLRASPSAKGLEDDEEMDVEEAV